MMIGYLREWEVHGKKLKGSLGSATL